MDDIKLYLCDKKKGACGGWRHGWKQCMNEMCFHTANEAHRKPLAVMDKPQFARLERSFGDVPLPVTLIEYRKICDKEEYCRYCTTFPEVRICCKDGRCVYDG